MENEHGDGHDSEYQRGYFNGIRLGITIGLIKNYRRFIAEDQLFILRMLYKDDVISEIGRFHEIYGNIDSRKMAEHVIHESEYMVDMCDFGTYI